MRADIITRAIEELELAKSMLRKVEDRDEHVDHALIRISAALGRLSVAHEQMCEMEERQ